MMLYIKQAEMINLESKVLNINKKGKLEYITFKSFENTGVVNHAFTTRHGGVSSGIYSQTNMSFTNGDTKENVLENYNRICSAINVKPENCVLSHQTHTVNLKTVTEADAGKGITRERDYENIDGLVTNVPGIVLVTQYADCVPLLFLDPVKKVIAASHAGWRGTVGKIGKLTTEKMAREFGCNPKDILVGIAPSIKQCCFEVDEPVYEEFKNLDCVNINDICIEKAGGKYNIDLQKTNALILESAGIPKENITITDLCTKCLCADFHSHRGAAGKRGNNAALIALKEL